MRNLLVFIIILCSCLIGLANDIRISNTVLSGQDTLANTISVRFDIQWENSWRTSSGPGNWDAAWVFVKYRLQGSSTWHHAYLAGQGHTPGSGAALELGLKNPASPFNQSNNPALGTFIYRSTEGDGLFSAAGVTLKWDYGANGLPDNAGEVEIKVFGIEMVLVPNGNFYLGSGGTETNRFHSGGNANGAFLVTGEQEIGIGTGSGQLYYTSDNEYAGDRQGPVPTAFPKGFKGFYAMKYEISQQQYADFLNTLNARQLDIRLNQQDFDSNSGSAFELQRTDTGFVTQRPYSACNFISVYDALAYSDWAGLRPMSEMEFEKAARGSLAPVPNEYAWGDTTLARQIYTSSNFGKVNEQITSNYQTQLGNAAYSTTTPDAARAPYRVGVFAGNPQNSGRRTAGSGYWGVMELSGNLYEYCVTAGSPAGRQFTGQHGDGSLDSLGNHNEPDWAGDAAAKYSLRGGAWSYTPGAMRTSDREFGGRLLFAPNLKRANKGYRGVRTAGGNYLSVSPAVLNFESDGGVSNVIISSDVPWTVSEDLSWLSVSTTTGSGNGMITLTAQANTATISRSGTITLSGSGVPAVLLTVNQAGVAPFLTATPLTLDFPAAGAALRIEVSSNVSWTASEDLSWLTVDSSSGSGNGTLTLTAEENISTYFRSGTLVLNAPGISPISFLITQANVASFFTASSSTLNIAAGCGSLEVRVNSNIEEDSSNVSWKFSPNLWWLSVSPSLENRNGTLTFTADPNHSATPRSGTVTLRINGIDSLVFTVVQAGMAASTSGDCGAFIAPGVWRAFMCHNLGAANTNADPLTPSWEINGGYWQWGRKEMAAEGPRGPGESEANAGAIATWNTTPAQDGSWNDCVKTVNDPCPEGFRVPTSIHWGLVINNNPKVTVGSSWVSGVANYNKGIRLGDKLFLPIAGFRSGLRESLPNDGSLIYRGHEGYYWTSSEFPNSANNLLIGEFRGAGIAGGFSRINGFSIRCIADSDTVAGALLPFISLDSIGLVRANSAAGGGLVRSDGGALVMARGLVWGTSPLPTVSLNTKTIDGIGTGSFTSEIKGLMPGRTYYVRAYATNSAGTAYSDNQISFTTPAAFMSVLPTNVGFGANGGDLNVEINSSVNWSVVENIPWLSLSMGQGSGNATLMLTAEPNATTTVRNGTITLSGPGVPSVEILVNQSSAAAFLSASPTTLNFGSVGSSLSVDIASNVNWTVSEGIWWLKVDTVNGIGSGTLLITVEPNASINARRGTVTLSGPGVPSLVLTINQPGQANGAAGECGAFIAPGNWRSFMCYNLGAANENADPFVPSWEINGGYWQWGRKEMAAAGPVGPGASQANDGAIAGWNSTAAPASSWSDLSKTANDPCPEGFRVPTFIQWQGVIANNTATDVGSSWTGSTMNYSTGKKFGEKLFLPAAGFRISVGGKLGGRGSIGNFWSSSPVNNSDGQMLYFYSKVIGQSFRNRTDGFSIRCISEPSATAISLPELTTSPVFSVTETSGQGGGTVTFDGNAEVTARGVVWSTSENPTVELATKTINGAGAGSFSSNITGLMPGTDYYVRAYATNSAGTGYGAQRTFTTNITSINCAEAVVDGTLAVGVSSSVTVYVPYTGGNGGTYYGNYISSSGVTGLTATLSFGKFTTGALALSISGTPSEAGIATFPISVGGKSCTLSVTVFTGNISSISCSGATNNGNLVVGVPASGVVSQIPYTGGNGGTHGGQTINSIGVTGLTATLPAGNFATGAGSLSYSINGTPSSFGTAQFIIKIGGQSCSLSRTVEQGSVTALTCGSTSGTLVDGEASNGVSFEVAYIGGNGGAYSARTIASSGVTGLTATLPAGTFNSGGGNLTLNITGIPNGSGNANFEVNIGGQTCLLVFPVSGRVPFLTVTPGALDFRPGGGGLHVEVRSNISWTVSEDISWLSVGTSTGSGSGTLILTAEINSSMNARSGTVTLSGSGVPAVVLTVMQAGATTTCGAYIAPNEWAEFMCYNLGAANPNADPFTPSWEINGGYWQWGRKEMAAPGPSGPGADQANTGPIAGWDQSFISIESWSEFSKTANDPCPSGYRVPTPAQWLGVISHNQNTIVGSTWESKSTNYTTGIKFGEKLFLPAAGEFSGFNSASLGGRGSRINYYAARSAASMGIRPHGIPYIGYSDHAQGFSLRCISENALKGPVVKTDSIGMITPTGATVGGTVSYLDGNLITARGVVWDINPSPTIALATQTINGRGTGSFSTIITGLIPGTTYYVRAFSRIGNETFYGEPKQFTTPPSNAKLPVVETVNVSTGWCTQYGFGCPLKFTGMVSDEGGEAVIRGFVWDTKPNVELPESTLGVGTDSIASCCLSEITPSSDTINPALDMPGRLEKIKVLFPGSSKPTEITVEIKDSLVFWNDDIILFSEEEYNLKKMEKGNMIPFTNKRWPNGVIPYVIEAGFPDVGMILDAINYINAYSNICMVPRTTEANYVEFVYQRRCASWVGMLGGRQEIKVFPDCRSAATIHEICHAAGIWHEQSRNDRDMFVEVKYENIEPSKWHNFEKRGEEIVGIGEYDFSSIMHYPGNAFSIPSAGPSIVIHSGTGMATWFNESFIMGQRSGLSPGDITSINSMYPVKNCDFSARTLNGTGVGTFSKEIQPSVRPGFKYYVRAYATNSAGTAYGEEKVIEIPVRVPVVSMGTHQVINDTTVKVFGAVLFDGGADVIARGVEWSTDQFFSNSKRTSDGVGIGRFTSTISGLSPGTTYYARAYATNSAGTGYISLANGVGIVFTTNIPTINCTGAVLDASLASGVAASGVTVSVPYTWNEVGVISGTVPSFFSGIVSSGNYDSISTLSTGVTGLTATLSAGTFKADSGNLTFAITGTPSGAGIATFPMSIGGRSCTLSLPVFAGRISTINCTGATSNGTLVEGVPASGVVSQISYTGGDGGAHGGQTVNSTGVTGLTATLSPGSFANGSGSLIYAISGTPSRTGNAVFKINIGGQTCGLILPVNFDNSTARVIVMKDIPAGTFPMGCTMGDKDCDYEGTPERPVHNVTLSAFQIGETEITQAQYLAVMGNNPSFFGGCGLCPVEQVSWFDAIVFCNRLSEMEGLRPCYYIDSALTQVYGKSGGSWTLPNSGTVLRDTSAKGYRLPTEAEWEYAARGGDNSHIYSGGNSVDSVAWYSVNSGKQSQRVKGKRANGYGLYDMSGNVSEWCQDFYGGYTADAQMNPTGASVGNVRIIRGGSWYLWDSACRVSYRGYWGSRTRGTYGGFRVVRWK